MASCKTPAVYGMSANEASALEAALGVSWAIDCALPGWQRSSPSSVEREAEKSSIERGIGALKCAVTTCQRRPAAWARCCRGSRRQAPWRCFGPCRKAHARKGVPRYSFASPHLCWPRCSGCSGVPECSRCLSSSGCLRGGGWRHVKMGKLRGCGARRGKETRQRQRVCVCACVSAVARVRASTWHLRARSQVVLPAEVATWIRHGCG